MRVLLFLLWLLPGILWAADSSGTVDALENARKALYKSLVQPGWGQWQNHHPLKALAFVGGEAGLLSGIVVQHRRWRDCRRRAAAAAPDRQNALQRRADFYLRDRNKLLWWLLWFEIINGTDAYVDAALADFDISGDLSWSVPAGGGWLLKVSLRTGIFR